MRKPAELSSQEFQQVRVPLNSFDIVRSRMDGSAIRNIVFGTWQENAQGVLYIYDIKISQ